ncbi:hypothetical protein HOLleu_20440 [Holothuria leucospilota]|uniref:Uncharacterized protein n=1 Tax=Holothuria leucospilota TaxID=206669 RepID=A0A9Q1C123_HOLLE|nr:hypothetical protein HOLleu_20440 [Holothuria leucospilota]
MVDPTKEEGTLLHTHTHTHTHPYAPYAQSLTGYPAKECKGISQQRSCPRKNRVDGQASGWAVLQGRHVQPRVTSVCSDRIFGQLRQFRAPRELGKACESRALAGCPGTR